MDTKRSLKNKLLSRTVAFAFALFFLGYGSASAATMRINSNSTTLLSGSIMTFSVVLNSEGIAINNAEAIIAFPKDLLEVVSISKGGSIFSLWVEEPSFSNTTGIIAFNGGVPTPGFTGPSGTVVSVVVRAKKTGQAELIFSDAAVRANDGLGTNVLTAKQGITISINKGAEAPVKPTPTSPGPALEISSPTHPNQNQWYKDNSPTFAWTIPTGSDAVQTGINDNTSGSPRVTYSPAISEKTVKDLKDGVWYFKVRAQRDGVWGSTDTYIVRVDTTAPQKKTVDFSYDNNAKVLNIAVDIQDITSGIDRYDIYINDNLAKTVPAKEFVSGKYGFGINASGNNTVKLTAIDRAGNFVETTGSFEATSVSFIELDPLAAIISAYERLFVSGTAPNPDAGVVVTFSRPGFDEPLLLATKANADARFAVSPPSLLPGHYEIWAETGAGEGKVISPSRHIEVTSQFLIRWGSFTIRGIYLLSAILLFLVLLLVGAYYVGYRNSRFQHRLKLKTVLVKGDNSKALATLKRRLERHLEILQTTRHTRILTKEEKEIKGAIEGDLDEVDKIIEEQKK